MNARPDKLAELLTPYCQEFRNQVCLSGLSPAKYMEKILLHLYSRPEQMTGQRGQPWRWAQNGQSQLLIPLQDLDTKKGSSRIKAMVFEAVPAQIDAATLHGLQAIAVPWFMASPAELLVEVLHAAAESSPELQFIETHRLLVMRNSCSSLLTLFAKVNEISEPSQS